MPSSKLPSKSIRLKRLIEAGYFPAELPPPFVTYGFSRYRAFIAARWPTEATNYKCTMFEAFSVPRYTGARRRLGILNPISYFGLAREISENWAFIRDFLRQSRVSAFRPVYDLFGERAFFGIDFRRVDESEADILARYDSCLKTDVTRYYPSIYTHAIGWALFGKENAKASLGKPPYKNSLGDRLDTLVRKCQDNQSVGIPIGPDTSRILGEIIGVAIESRLKGELPCFEERSLRYVDDIAIGFSAEESADHLQSVLMSALSYYELDINVDKTTVIGRNATTPPEWIPTLRQFRLGRGTKYKRETLDDFFKTAIILSEEHPKESVLPYAVKRSRSFRVDNELWPYYESLLLRVARKNATAIPAVTQILVERNYEGYPISRDRVGRFVSDLIRTNAPVHHDFEVCWSLFLAKALRMNLSESELQPVLGRNSASCALIVLDLRSRGLVPSSIDIGTW